MPAARPAAGAPAAGQDDAPPADPDAVADLERVVGIVLDRVLVEEPTR
jgi:hypothetical protein